MLSRAGLRGPWRRRPAREVTRLSPNRTRSAGLVRSSSPGEPPSLCSVSRACHRSAGRTPAGGQTLSGRWPGPQGEQGPRPSGEGLPTGRPEAQADLHDFILGPGGRRVSLAQSGFVRHPGRAQRGHRPRGAAGGAAHRGSRARRRPVGTLGSRAQAGRRTPRQELEGHHQPQVPRVEVADAGREGEDGTARVAGGTEREQRHQHLGDSGVWPERTQAAPPASALCGQAEEPRRTGPRRRAGAWRDVLCGEDVFHRRGDAARVPGGSRGVTVGSRQGVGGCVCRRGPHQGEWARGLVWQPPSLRGAPWSRGLGACDTGQGCKDVPTPLSRRPLGPSSPTSAGPFSA